jgi:hypothetical protein
MQCLVVSSAAQHIYVVRRQRVNCIMPVVQHKTQDMCNSTSLMCCIRLLTFFCAVSYHLITLVGLKALSPRIKVARTWNITFSHLYVLSLIHTCHTVPMPCRAPTILRQCHVLHKSPCGSWKYLNC